MTLPGYFWYRWLSLAGKLSWDIAITQVNSALHPSGVTKSSTSFGWGKNGKVTAARWQVTLCGPIWHVISHIVWWLTRNCYICHTLLHCFKNAALKWPVHFTVSLMAGPVTRELDKQLNDHRSIVHPNDALRDMLCGCCSNWAIVSGLDAQSDIWKNADAKYKFQLISGLAELMHKTEITAELQLVANIFG